jgi:hypothetical protein
MTPREMLALAAKAAGIEVPKLSNGRPSPWFWIDDNGIHEDISGGGDGTSHRHWNPLASDGDALRLAVKVLNWPHVGRAFENQVTALYVVGKLPKDPYVATRLAIVRAAAAIGRSMP